MQFAAARARPTTKGPQNPKKFTQFTSLLGRPHTREYQTDTTARSGDSVCRYGTTTHTLPSPQHVAVGVAIAAAAAAAAVAAVSDLARVAACPAAAAEVSATRPARDARERRMRTPSWRRMARERQPKRGGSAAWNPINTQRRRMQGAQVLGVDRCLTNACAKGEQKRRGVECLQILNHACTVYLIERG